MGHQPDIGAHKLGETMVFTVTVQNAVHGLLSSTKIISLSRSRPVLGGVGEGFCLRPAFHAGGPGKCPVSQPVGLSPQGEGHPEAWGGGRGGSGGAGRGSRCPGLPGCQSPSVPSFPGRDDPSHAAQFGRVGRRGWAPSARPSIYHMAGEPQKQQLWPRP